MRYEKQKNLNHFDASIGELNPLVGLKNKNKPWESRY